MGNVAVHDFDPVQAGSSRKELNLRRPMTSDLYRRHANGENIPGCLDQLPWVVVDSISLYEHVDASFNHITAIPPELPLRIPHLTFLNLNHNRLTQLPQSFSLFYHLKTLFLSYNNLQGLPASFLGLRCLETVDLSYNCIEYLPDDMGKMEALCKLNVSHNKIQSLPVSLATSKALKFLLASSNLCVNPPQSVCDLGSKATMDFISRNLPNGTGLHSPSSSYISFIRIRGDMIASSPDAASHSARFHYMQEQTDTLNTLNRSKTPLRPPPDATSLLPDELMDRIVGLIYGAMIGDAIGILTAHMSPDLCEFSYDLDTFTYNDMIVDDVRSIWKAGDWTANGDQILLVLDGVLQWAGVVDELDFAKRLQFWLVYGFRELGDIQGLGLDYTTVQLLSDEQYVSDPHSYAKAMWEHCNQNCAPLSQCNNTAISRATVLGVPQFHDLNDVIGNAARLCKATHYDPRSQASCVAVSLIIALILQGRDKMSGDKMNSAESVLETAQKTGQMFLASEQDRREFDTCFSLKTFTSISCNQPGMDRHTYKALAAGVVATRTTDDFQTALTKLVMCGGAANTNGCVAGAVLGCRLGFSQLPRHWVEGLDLKHKHFLDMKINLFLDMMGIP